MEEGVILDFFSAISPKTLIGVESHQSLHEIACFVRELDPVFVPFDVAGQDIFKNLLWRLRVKRRDTIEELVCDDTQSPLTRQKSASRVTKEEFKNKPSLRLHRHCEGQKLSLAQRNPACQQS